jgi:hypothetical protein
MIEIPDFHDRSFDGLWISDQKRIHLFLRTVEGERFTLLLDGVKLLRALNVREGNIILDLNSLDSAKLTADHIEEVYDLAEADKEAQITKFLRSAKDAGLNAFEMSSAYGAECIALFTRAELRRNHFCPEPSPPAE